MTRVWLRLDQRARRLLGPPLDSATSPVLVELSPDGTVRPVESEVPHADTAPAIKLASDLRRWPTALHGLGLFAQRRVELHLNAPDGPVIGTAHPGAYLPVVELGTAFVEIALPGYQAAGAPIAAPVRVFADAGALGIDSGAQRSAAPAIPAWPAAFRDHDLPLSAAPGAPPFATTLCGPLWVLGRSAGGEAIDGGGDGAAGGGAPLHVVQERQGVEIAGWIAHEPSERRGSHACAPRVTERSDPTDPHAPVALAPGYVPYVAPSVAAVDPLETLVRRGGPIYWLVSGEKEQVTCVEWRLKPRARTGAGPAVIMKADLRRSYELDGRRRTTSFELTYTSPRDARPALVGLLGPSWDSDGRAEGVALCGDVYSVVGAARGQIALLRGDYPNGIVGYHADDSEIWYWTRAACEAAAASAASVPLAGGDHLHHGC